MRPRAAFWSTTTFVVSGSFLPLAMSDSRRSTRKMMSMAVALLRRGLWHGRERQRDRATRSRAARAAAGSIAETSPPNAAISLARLELT